MKSIVNAGLFTAAMMIGTVGISYGAPIVSSSVIQGGDTIQIQGSGFGSHVNYGMGQPFLNRAWNNMESGNINDFTNSNPAGGNLRIEWNPENWQMVGTGNRPNSRYFIKKWYNPALGDRLGPLGLTETGNPTQWYTTFWFKLLPNTQSGKFFRIWGTGQDIYLCTGGTDTYIRCGSSAYGATQWASPNTVGYDLWHRIEIWMDESTQEFSVWMDGNLQFTHYDWIQPPFGANGHTWDIGNMIDDDNGSGAYCYDDIFLNYTKARVEIGNAPTWTDSTVREIQIPTSWSSSSISVKLNKGAFQTGSTAYLFVVDSDGSVSNGYPITIGTSGSGTQLSAPQNFHISQ